MGNPRTGSRQSLGASLSSVSSSATSVTLLAQNLDRHTVIIHNTDANTLYVAFASSATAAIGGYSYPVASGAILELIDCPYIGAISGIWSADGSGGAAITEI